MEHVAEFLALLVLLSVGRGVVDVSPAMGRRIGKSLFCWVILMGAVVATLRQPYLAIWALRLGIVLIGVFFVQWILRGIVGHITGPHLIAEPHRRALAEAGHYVSGLPLVESQRIARRVSREHHAYVALMALGQLEAEESLADEPFETLWMRECESSLAELRELVLRCHGRGENVRVGANDLLFAAQAMFLYEAKAVQRVLARMGAKAFGNRSRRAAVAAELEKIGRPSVMARELGLVSTEEKKAGDRKSPIRLGTVLWPAAGIARAGFSQRAIAFVLCFVLLVIYGAFAVHLHRTSGWVYLAVALLIHVEAVFALGDFSPPPPTPKKSRS